MTSGSKKILLISRLSTQNAGNEALSKILIDYFGDTASSAEVFALDRCPRYFEQFRIEGDLNGLVGRFDQLAKDLTRKFAKRDATLPPPAVRSSVKLDHSAKELKGFWRRVKRQLGVRRRLAALRLIEGQDPITTVSACTQCDLLVWNPAGEIHPTGNANEVFRLLLLLRIAQLSGKRTAVVNHSLEIENAALRSLLAHVYSHLDYVGVRDATSVKVAAQLGASAKKIVEAPDLVFLASREVSPRPATPESKGAIGIAVNGLEALSGSNEWDELMVGLKSFGRPFVFVSNAVNHDVDFSTKLAKSLPKAEVVSHQPGYEALRGYFQQCSVLISSRLHSSILALCEGVPVVSIEPSVFKLTAIFKQLEYPIETESLLVPGWASRTLSNVGRCLADEDGQLARFGEKKVIEQAERIDRAYAPLFGLVAP